MIRSNNNFFKFQKKFGLSATNVKLLNTIRSTVFPGDLARKTKRTNGSTTRCPTGRPTVAFGADRVGAVAYVLDGYMPNTAVPESVISVFCYQSSRRRWQPTRFWTLVTRLECSLLRHRSLAPRVTRTPDVLSSFRRVGCDWSPSGSSRPSAAHVSTPDTSRGLK